MNRVSLENGKKKESKEKIEPQPCKKPSSIRTVLISGTGFLADAYDFFVIDFVLAILEVTAKRPPTLGEKSLIVSSTLAGAVIGQIIFGFLADSIGRRVMFILSAGLVTASSVLSAITGINYHVHDSPFSVYLQLAICRFFLGLGIGGEYPLSATVTSECSTDQEEEEEEDEYEKEEDAVPKVAYQRGPKKFRDLLKSTPNSVAAVFSMQGVGMTLSPLIVMLCIACQISLQHTWRVCLGVGAIPSVIAFGFRWRFTESMAYETMRKEMLCSESMTAMPNDCDDSAKSGYDISPTSSTSSCSVVMEHGSNALTVLEESLKTKRVGKNSVIKAGIPTRGSVNASLSILSRHLNKSKGSIKKFSHTLIGTSLAWFLIDVTLYGVGSFKTAILADWSRETSSSAVKNEVKFSSYVLTTEAYAFKDNPLLPLVPALPHQTLALENTEKEERTGTLTAVQRLRRNTPTVEGSQANVRVLSDQSHSSASSSLSSPSSSSSSSSKNEEQSVRDVMKKAQYCVVIALIGIPGYILSVLFIHKTGIKRLQFWGFLAVAFSFWLLSLEQYLKLNLRYLELTLLGITFLCSNFGPNTTTFILPTLVFPTIIKGTFHGTSAAMGKLGGVTGTSLFEPIRIHFGLTVLLALSGCVSCSGAAVTYFLIPSDEKANRMLKQNQIETAVKKGDQMSCSHHQKDNFEGEDNEIKTIDFVG